MVLVITLITFAILPTFTRAMIRYQAIEAQPIFLHKGTAIFYRLCLEISTINDKVLTTAECALCLVALVLHHYRRMAVRRILSGIDFRSKQGTRFRRLLVPTDCSVVGLDAETATAQVFSPLI